MKPEERQFEDELEKPQPLPINPRLAIQMGRGTIKSIADAIVELITNSDDSYKRLEGKKSTVDGKIIIKIHRLKGGKCKKLDVIDFAEGMDKEALKEALEFAGESSGFQQGKSVRGFFGRGLKEAILTLGTGEVYTVKDNKLSRAILWQERNKPMYQPPKQSYVVNEKEREEIGIGEGNGTVVRISVATDKIKCPDLKTLLPQVQMHYALRDINSDPNRKITLEFESPEQGKQFKRISYEAPRGNKKVDKSIELPVYGDKIQITIYESEEELESPYRDPCARSGLLIKTEGAILDNQLFQYQTERAGRFFYGEIIWPKLAARLRAEESLLDLNRGGIEWQQEICLVLQSKVEELLGPLIQDKKRELDAKQPVSIPLPIVKTKNRHI